jgi:hypothetical protein
MAREPKPYAYAFNFYYTVDGVPGWHSVEANALAHALKAAPDLQAAHLDNVWCLNSLNMIWGQLQQPGGLPPEPWVDEEDELAESDAALVHPWTADTRPLKD